MCLIIHNPKAKQVPAEIIENALYLNADGFGIFYHDTGEIRHSMKWDDQWALLSTGRPYTAHFRYATSGPIGLKQCHPFQIDSTYSLMMNGTIDRLRSAMSVDTVELCGILDGLSEEKMLAVLATHPCRFALLNRLTGKATLVNNDLWTARDGVHYSKANCFPAKRSAATYKTSYRADELDHDATFEQDWRLYGSCEDEWGDDEDEWGAPVEPEPGTGPLVSVAVYGTLKHGHGNHRLLEHSYCLGDGYTSQRYPLVIDGLPYMIDREGYGKRVRVEVYRVCAATLARLDGLEGHPDWYERRETQVQLVKGGTVTAWVYMIPDSRSYTHMQDTGIYHECF